MDMGQFDDMARTLAVEEGSRREAVRMLAGGVLAALAVRLGLTSDAVAERERKKRKHRSKPNRNAGLHSEGKQKKKKGKGKGRPKNPTPPGDAPNQLPDDPADPVWVDFSCAAGRCQMVAVDTDEAKATLGTCVNDGTMLGVCENALGDAEVRVLTDHLRNGGYSPDADQVPAVESLLVFDDQEVVERVIVLRFARRTGGQTALLRYGETPGQERPSTYALVQQGNRPAAILTVDGNGRVIPTPVATAPASRQRGKSRKASGRATRSADDNPYRGQADELCLECPVVCKALGSIECGLLVLSRTSNPIAALIGSKVCEKPLEAACGPYCGSMIGPALEDDPQNCGACGRACPGGHECCKGTCLDTRFDPQNCGGCGKRCSSGSTCCDGICVDLKTDPNFCGSCGNRCTGDKDTCCNGQCVDVSTDYRHCGECDSFCGGYEEVCRNGFCDRPTCPPSRRCAFGFCCPEGTACGGGACCGPDGCQCVPGLKLCNGVCCAKCLGSACCDGGVC